MRKVWKKSKLLPATWQISANLNVFMRKSNGPVAAPSPELPEEWRDCNARKWLLVLMKLMTFGLVRERNARSCQGGKYFPSALRYDPHRHMQPGSYDRKTGSTRLSQYNKGWRRGSNADYDALTAILCVFEAASLGFSTRTFSTPLANFASTFPSSGVNPRGTVRRKLP